MNFDYESRKLGMALANVLNEYNLPVSLKVFVLDEITTSFRQQMEANIQLGFEEDRAKAEAENGEDKQVKSKKEG